MIPLSETSFPKLTSGDICLCHERAYFNAGRKSSRDLEGGTSVSCKILPRP